jgi:hypothetical protein
MAQRDDRSRGEFRLKLSPATLQYVIGEARLCTKPAAVAASNPLTDSYVRHSYPRQVVDPSRAKLATFIGHLGKDEQAELVALAWLGRGTYEADEWEEALSEANAACCERTPDYVSGLPMLGDCLEEGLASLAARGSQRDRNSSRDF